MTYEDALGCEVNDKADEQFNSLLMINDSYTHFKKCPMGMAPSSCAYLGNAPHSMRPFNAGTESSLSNWVT